jgi:aminoglycoside/choline kinase family phosphotransferase
MASFGHDPGIRRMTLPTRAAERLAWTRSALRDPQAQLESASADASFRSYWRSQSGDRTWIVMDAPPDKEDIRPWLDIAQRLNAAGLHAPEIQASDAELGFVLMADLGTRLYLPALNEKTVDGLYADALDAMLGMQIRVDAADLPPYDESRLVAEMELMPTWFLTRHLGFTPECDDWDVIELAFRALVSAAVAQPQAFVHRDYHSRNLLIADDNNPGILDFQDAVRGPVTYDLVSLLRDCYIAWPEPRIDAWVEDYRQRLVGAGITDADCATFRRSFDLMGLQRHIKVLGIFCRLWYRDGKAGYLNDLPLVWKYTREVGLRHAEIAPLIGLIERALGERDITLPLA